jgi:hypothetical protein
MNLAAIGRQHTTLAAGFRRVILYRYLRGTGAGNTEMETPL